jgi:hypothetical protein
MQSLLLFVIITHTIERIFKSRTCNSWKDFPVRRKKEKSKYLVRYMVHRITNARDRHSTKAGFCFNYDDHRPFGVHAYRKRNAILYTRPRYCTGMRFQCFPRMQLYDIRRGVTTCSDLIGSCVPMVNYSALLGPGRFSSMLAICFLCWPRDDFTWAACLATWTDTKHSLKHTSEFVSELRKQTPSGNLTATGL